LEGLPSAFACPIALYPASSFSEKVSFNRINRKTGNRLKQQNIDSETGEVVPREDTARGYEVGKGRQLIVEDEEFEAVEIEITRTMRSISSFRGMRSMSATFCTRDWHLHSVAQRHEKFPVELPQ
jgi:DNA end-binding protein Ku